MCRKGFPAEGIPFGHRRFSTAGPRTGNPATCSKKEKFAGLPHAASINPLRRAMMRAADQVRPGRSTVRVHLHGSSFFAFSSTTKDATARALSARTRSSRRGQKAGLRRQRAQSGSLRPALRRKLGKKVWATGKAYGRGHILQGAANGPKVGRRLMVAAEDFTRPPIVQGANRGVIEPGAWPRSRVVQTSRCREVAKKVALPWGGRFEAVIF